MYRRRRTHVVQEVLDHPDVMQQKHPDLMKYQGGNDIEAVLDDLYLNEISGSITGFRTLVSM